MKYDTKRADTLAYPVSSRVRAHRNYRAGRMRVRPTSACEAGVAELVYAADSKPAPARVEGSNPSPGTSTQKKEPATSFEVAGSFF